MATFLVERYWPGVTVELFIDAVRRVDEAVARLRRDGTPIRTVASTLVPDDEAAYWIVDAASAEQVELAYRQAGIPVERIVAALEVRPAADWRRTRMQPVGPGIPGREEPDKPGESSADVLSATVDGGAEA